MLFCIIKTNLSLKYLVSLLISKTVSYTHSCCLYYIGTTAYYIAIKNVNLQFTELSYPVDLTWFIWSPVSRVLNHPASIAYSTWGWIHLEMPPKNRGRPGFDLTGILHLYCTALLSSFYARDLHIILWMPTMTESFVLLIWCPCHIYFVLPTRKSHCSTILCISWGGRAIGPESKEDLLP